MYSGMKEEQEVLVTHGYGITKIGPELKIIATSDGHIQGKDVPYNEKIRL